MILTVINRIAQSAITLMIGFLLGRIARTLAYRILNEAEINKFTTTIGIESEKSISRLAELTVYAITIILALKALKILNATIILMAGITATALAGTIIIESIDLMQNIGKRKIPTAASGRVFLTLRTPLQMFKKQTQPLQATKYSQQIKKHLKSRLNQDFAIKGKTIKTGLTETIIQTKQETYAIPNKLIRANS